MTWGEVMGEAVTPMLEGDAVLVATLGGKHIYAGQASRPVRIPSVEWVLTDDALTEVFNPLEAQFDYWAKNMEQAQIIESRLRFWLHRDTRRVLAGINMSTLYVDSFTHEYPQPGIMHRSLRFRFEPVRARPQAES